MRRGNVFNKCYLFFIKGGPIFSKDIMKPNSWFWRTWFTTPREYGIAFPTH